MRINNLVVCLLLLAVICVNAQDKPFEGITATNLENVRYPFPVHFIGLNIQGEQLKMEYMDVHPDKPNGETVLLLHGKNFCSAYWEQTAKDLSRQGFRVVIPDQIGFGKSSKPEHIQYSFQLLALNTKSILDSLHVDRVTVVGHSMGGMLATRFTLMFPDRVSKLVLENPLGLEDWKLYVPYQTVDNWYAGELKQNYNTLKQYQLDFYYGGHWKPEYDQWIEIAAGWTNAIDYPRIAWNSALTYDMIFTQPVCYEFQHIKVPTLLIIGQRDRTALAKNKAPEAVKGMLGNYPLLGRETAKKIPHSVLVELDNVGHLPHIEAYDRYIKALIDFLK